jgi:hypothetical protein
MTTWKIEICEKKGKQFPWIAAVVASTGKRQQVGEFIDAKDARSYANMELNRLSAKDASSSNKQPVGV